ncbi:MAG: hypothetical protein ABSH50_29420 [Bryobacteraceae bacterium]|jgi:hypothetical protein
MDLFNVQRLAECLQRLAAYSTQCSDAAKDDGGQVWVDSSIDDLRSIVKDLWQVCIDNGFNDAAEDVHETYKGINYDLNVAALVEITRRIESAVTRALRTFRVIAVQNDRVRYADNAGLFADLRAAFPSAIYDLTEAASCLSVECPTACVFHAMRAAEIGLRALARDRGIKVPKSRPLEFATWETIIRELEKAETEIMNYPQTAARESQFDFYHGAMMEFRAFKNKFRNPAMHSRDRFDRDEAHSALTHAVDFLRVLSTKIGERKRTPKIWRRP